MAHIQYVDGLVREYLLFRGFSHTLKCFDSELKTDKDKGFRVDKIIDQITHSINIHDLQALREIWYHLDGHLFSKLEHTFATAVKKLEHSIFKLYLITAFIAGKSDKVTEFFNKLAPELHSQSEWKDWFFFPFCKNPEEHPVFAVCFSKQWQDTLMISLHNFLATIFQCMPQPTLSRIETEASLIKKLQEENANLRSRIQMMANTNTNVIGSNQDNPQGIVPPSTSSYVPTSSSSTHRSRISTFHNKKPNADNGNSKRQSRTASNPQNLNDIVPFDIPPPPQIVDDFYIIAQESMNISHTAEMQARGLRSLIRNISSGGSPVMGRKESADRSKKRSGSVGSRSWNMY